jgi:hypothetical protein
MRRQITVRAAMADHQWPGKFFPVAVPIAAAVGLSRKRTHAAYCDQQTACDGTVFHDSLLMVERMTMNLECGSYSMNIYRDPTAAS